MKFIATINFFMVFLMSICVAEAEDRKATLADGTEVLLREDGTWEEIKGSVVDNFTFNCPEEGTFTVPNQQKSIVRFDMKYMPSFTEDKVILEADNQNILIDLNNGALFVDGKEYDKCEILAVPKNIIVSSDNFIFNCPDEGAFTVPNQQKSIVRWDLEYMPSFTEDKVILESDNQNILIDLNNGALFVDGKEYVKCEILAVPKN